MSVTEPTTGLLCTDIETGQNKQQIYTVIIGNTRSDLKKQT